MHPQVLKVVNTITVSRRKDQATWTKTPKINSST